MKTPVSELPPSMRHGQAVFENESHVGALVFGGLLGETLYFGYYVRTVVGIRTHNQRVVFGRHQEVLLKP